MTLTVGERVLIIRRRSRLSQKEFGNLLDVCGDTVKNWELGKTKPTAKDVEKLAVLEARQGGK